MLRKEKNMGEITPTAKERNAATDTTDGCAAPESEKALFNEISLLIEQCRHTIYRQINGETVLLFWKVGRRINMEILRNRRAEYGKRIVVTLSRQLTAKYGRNFAEYQTANGNDWNAGNYCRNVSATYRKNDHEPPDQPRC